MDPPSLFITAGVSLAVLIIFSVGKIASPVVVVASSSTPSTFYLRVSLGLSGESDALNLCVNYHVRDNNQSTGNMRHRPRQIEQCVSWGFEVSVPLCITMRPVLAARRFQKSKSYCQVKHKVELVVHRVRKTWGTRFLRKVWKCEEGQVRILCRNVASANKYELHK